MKYSFHSGAFYKLPITEVISKLKKYGYDAIELNGEHLPWIENEEDIHIRPDMSDDQVQKIKEALSQQNLAVSALSAHIGLIEKDPQKRKAVVEHSKKLIDIAKELGTDVVHGLSGFKPEGMDDEEAWSILTNGINEIVEHAERKNMKYAFEPVVGMFINTGERLNILRGKISTGTLYINFDPSHLILVNDNIKKLVHDFHDDIIHVHYKDGEGNTNKFEFPPVGKGKVDLKGFTAALKRIGYDGYLSIEYEANYFGSYSNDIDQVAKESIQFMRSNV